MGQDELPIQIIKPMACRQRKYTFIAIAVARAPRVKLWQMDDSFGDACPIEVFEGERLEERLTRAEQVGHDCTTHFAVDNYAISIAGSGVAWEDFPRGVPGFANMILLLRGYGG